MTIFRSSGASVLMSVSAIEALETCLSRMSPAMRCEKNSIGRCRTFHINNAVLQASIRAFSRFDMSTVTADTNSSNADNSVIAPINGYIQPGFAPVSS